MSDTPRTRARKLVHRHLFSNPARPAGPAGPGRPVSMHRDPGRAPLSPVAGSCRWLRAGRRHRQLSFRCLHNVANVTSWVTVGLSYRSVAISP